MKQKDDDKLRLNYYIKKYACLKSETILKYSNNDKEVYYRSLAGQLNGMFHRNLI